MTAFKITEGKGNARAKKAINTQAKRTKKGIKNAFIQIRKNIVDESKRLITDPPKTGRVYLIRLRGKTIRHQASAAGQAPANLSGKLRSTVAAKVNASSTQMEFGAGNNSVRYAGILEVGGGRIKKRPYLIKSINNNRKNIEVHFKIRLKKEITK